MYLIKIFKYHTEKRPQQKFNIAAECGWTDKLQNILDSGARINLEWGMDSAIRGGNQDAFDFLRKSGVDIRKEGANYDHVAAVAKKLDMLKLLQKNGVKLSPHLFISAAENNDIPMLEYLAHDQKLNIYGSYDNRADEPTYLDRATYSAAKSGKTDALGWLLEWKPNIYGEFDYALSGAIACGIIPAVKMMLKHKDTDVPRAIGVVMRHAAYEVKLKLLNAAIDVVKPKMMESPALFFDTLEKSRQYAQGVDREKRRWKNDYSTDSAGIVQIISDTLYEIKTYSNRAKPTVKSQALNPV